MRNNYKSRKICPWLALCLLVLVFAGCGRESKKAAEPLEKGTLKVGMNLSIPSMCYLDKESGQPEGFEVELAGKLAEQMGLKLEIVDTSKENLLKSLDAKLYDCVISATGIAAWNESHYSHTAPYADVSSVREQIKTEQEFTDIAVFTKKNNPMAKVLDEKLTELKKSGTLTELSKKYFDKDIVIKE